MVVGAVRFDDDTSPQRVAQLDGAAAVVVGGGLDDEDGGSGRWVNVGVAAGSTEEVTRGTGRSWVVTPHPLVSRQDSRTAVRLTGPPRSGSPSRAR